MILLALDSCGSAPYLVRRRMRFSIRLKAAEALFRTELPSVALTMHKRLNGTCFCCLVDVVTAFSNAFKKIFLAWLTTRVAEPDAELDGCSSRRKSLNLVSFLLGQMIHCRKFPCHRERSTCLGGFLNGWPGVNVRNVEPTVSYGKGTASLPCPLGRLIVSNGLPLIKYVLSGYVIFYFCSQTSRIKCG